MPLSMPEIRIEKRNALFIGVSIMIAAVILTLPYFLKYDDIVGECNNRIMQANTANSKLFSECMACLNKKNLTINISCT